MSGPARNIWRQHTDSEWFREASPNTIRVLWALTLHRREDMKAGRISSFTGVERLAKEAGLSKRSIQTHLGHLKAAGIIEAHSPRPGRPTPTYYWAFPSPPKRGSGPGAANPAVPETLMFHSGQGWKELSVDAIARQLLASPKLESHCCERGRKEVKPAEDWRQVQEAMEAIVRARQGTS